MQSEQATIREELAPKGTALRVEQMAARLAAEQKAQAAEAEDGPIALLDYATDEERAELKRIRDARDAAEAEQRRLTLKAAEIEEQATLARMSVERAALKRRAALVSATLGESSPADVPAPAATDGASPDDLRDAATILRGRAKAKQEEATQHHGELRARTIALFKACANRAAADYLDRARRLAEIHAAIGAVQVLLNGLGNVYAGVTPEVIVGPDWDDLTIPGSEQLAPLRGKGHDAWFKRRLAGGDQGVCQKAAHEAYSAAQAEIRELVGWPLDRKG